MPFFNDGLVVDIDGSGNIWFARTCEYRISRRRLGGDTTRSFTLPAQATGVGNDEREYVRERLSARPALIPDYLNALPETRPVVHAILSDRAGNLFIVVNVEGVVEGTAIDVFRESGEYLGRMALLHQMPLLPPPRLVGWATGDHLLLVVLDDDSIPYVARSRLVKNG